MGRREEEAAAPVDLEERHGRPRDLDRHHGVRDIVRAPLGDVSDHAEEAEGVGHKGGHRRMEDESVVGRRAEVGREGAMPPEVGVVAGALRGREIVPRPPGSRLPAARRAFPLDLRRQLEIDPREDPAAGLAIHALDRMQKGEVSTRRGKQFNTLVYDEVDPITGAARNAIFMNPEDAAGLHLTHADRVALVNDLGRYEGRIFLAPIARGNLQVHWPEANGIIRRGVVDGMGGVPDYYAKVRVEKAPA